MNTPVLYIVIPCYNEEAVLPITAPLFLEKLRQLTGQGDRAVSSGKRGDTTITYASDSQTASADLTRTLAPFIHLRSPGAPKGRCC